MTSSERSALRIKRLAWMKNNPQAWTAWVVGAHNDKLHLWIVLQMKREGIIAPSTYWKDVNINDLVVSLRNAAKV